MDHDEEEVSTEFFPDVVLSSDDDGAEVPDPAWRLGKLGSLQCRIENLYRARFANGNRKIPLRLLLSVANDIFGYNGWSTEISELEIVSETKNSDKWSVVCVATIKVTLQDGASSFYSGKGTALELGRSLAYSTAKKLAITDATRNAILCLPHTSHEKFMSHDNAYD